MAIQVLGDVEVHWQGPKVKADITRGLNMGLKAAAIFFSGRVKELISVPAPRVRVHGKRGASAGIIYYRATTKATPGAPPRKLSGRLRTSVTWEMRQAALQVGGVMAGAEEARVGTNVVYGRTHEEGDHQFLGPALARWANELGRIIGQVFDSAVQTARP